MRTEPTPAVSDGESGSVHPSGFDARGILVALAILAAIAALTVVPHWIEQRRERDARVERCRMDLKYRDDSAAFCNTLVDYLDELGR